MTAGIGKKIRYYRIKARMTQEELANGVVSVSYLSKIEHNTAEPNHKAIKLLCDKLEIKPVCIKDEEIPLLCQKWFAELLYGNLATAHGTFQQINAEFEKVIDADLYWLVELHTLKFYLLTNQVEKAKLKYQCLDQNKHVFKGLEIYYWYKFSACFHVEKSAYNVAFEQFKQAEQLIKIEMHHYQYEIHDLYYQIAKVGTNLYFTYHAMLYAEKALEFYRSNYLLKHCAECHILTGIGYKRMNEIEESINSFQLAMTIAKEQQEHRLLAECHQHLGLLYKKSNQLRKALTYFHSSYQFVENTLTQEELAAAISIMKEYVDQNELEKAKDWYQKALIIIKKMQPYESLLAQEIKVYKYLIFGFTPSFEELMQKEVLPFLKDKQLYIEFATYLKITGEYFYRSRKYKIAADYYLEAFQAIEQIRRKDNN